MLGVSGVLCISVCDMKRTKKYGNNKINYAGYLSGTSSLPRECTLLKNTQCSRTRLHYLSYLIPRFLPSPGSTMEEL